MTKHDPRPIYRRDRTSGTDEVGSWMSSRAVLGVLKRKKSRNGSVKVKLEVEKKKTQMFIFRSWPPAASKQVTSLEFVLSRRNFKTFSTSEKLRRSSTENRYFRIFIHRPTFISCLVFLSLPFPSFLCKTVHEVFFFLSCGTLSSTDLQPVYVLENSGFPWIRREDDLTFQASLFPS